MNLGGHNQTHLHTLGEICLFPSLFSILQVKKLVYVYLVRYAEEQQDLALLSISTFQRGLKVKSYCFYFNLNQNVVPFMPTGLCVEPELSVAAAAPSRPCLFNLWDESCVFLKDPNQLIRASALRVLSSIRVTIIVPIMMLAIKEAASDMSPYVRKTAAHAIPKLYR